MAWSLKPSLVTSSAGANLSGKLLVGAAHWQGRPGKSGVPLQAQENRKRRREKLVFKRGVRSGKRDPEHTIIGTREYPMEGRVLPANFPISTLKGSKSLKEHQKRLLRPRTHRERRYPSRRLLSLSYSRGSGGRDRTRLNNLPRGFLEGGVLNPYSRPLC